jgi:hypothetical protein
LRTGTAIAQRAATGRRLAGSEPREAAMISNKLPLIFLLTLGGAACAPLAQYGSLAQPAPGAGDPSSAAPSEPSAAAPAGNSAAQTPAPNKPAAPSSVSVSIRNSCGQTVKVFYGEKPKFGSGTYSSASSNSVSNRSFRPGDQFWIVDDSQNGIANVQVGETTREIEITGSCDRLATR